MTVLLYFEHRDEDFAILASGTCPQSVCLSVYLSIWCRQVAILNRPEWHLDTWSLVLLRTCHVLETATNKTPLWTRLVCRPFLFNSVPLNALADFNTKNIASELVSSRQNLVYQLTGRLLGCGCVCGVCVCVWCVCVGVCVCGCMCVCGCVYVYVCVAGWLKSVYLYLRFKVFTTASSSESCRRSLNSCLTG